MLKVSYIHGWANGNRLDRKILACIQNHDYTVQKFAKEADVILTHSLGAFAVPKNSTAKLIVMVDPPYWPGKSKLRSIIENIQNEDTYSHGWRRSIYILMNQLYYVVVNFLGDVVRYKKAARLIWPKSKMCIVIRNESDAFCSPAIQNVLPKNYHYIELPGSHGDLYRNPQKYIKIIDGYADQLA